MPQSNRDIDSIKVPHLHRHKIHYFLMFDYKYSSLLPSKILLINLNVKVKYRGKNKYLDHFWVKLSILKQDFI